MRGTDHLQNGMFSYISAERRVPGDHPLRAIRAMVDLALSNMGSQFETMYAKVGRPSIPPEKLLRADVAKTFFAEVLAQARDRDLLSAEHFTVDGTLIEAWASHKSFKRKDGAGEPPPDDPGNPTIDFHGEQRSNATHQSTTD